MPRDKSLQVPGRPGIYYSPSGQTDKYQGQKRKAQTRLKSHGKAAKIREFSDEKLGRAPKQANTPGPLRNPANKSRSITDPFQYRF